jgi:hypothetical protein
VTRGQAASSLGSTWGGSEVFVQLAPEAIVTWEAPRAAVLGGPQGGALMQRVKVEGGDTRKVVLTQ